ncbi:MAG: S24/S26 family peptidase [Bacteroidaceae bacterium]|nr:S24/S26 family peptidase [Bacteroidaceae bacterium]MBP9637946.1 S24/S26 family peptidase [Bacteroidaceae bacterium]
MQHITVPNTILLPEVHQLLQEGHTVTLLVRGNSMNPFLVDRRDKVIIAPLPPDGPMIGDLPLAYDRQNQRYVLHRLIRKEGTNYILMGDGNLKGTESILPDDLIGIVTHLQRKGRTYSIQGKCWRIYSMIWLQVMPIRRILLALFRRI